MWFRSPRTLTLRNRTTTDLHYTVPLHSLHLGLHLQVQLLSQSLFYTGSTDRDRTGLNHQVRRSSSIMHQTVETQTHRDCRSFI